MTGARARLAEKIAEQDVARGRPLTDAERLENLRRGLMTRKEWLYELQGRVDEIAKPLEELGLEDLLDKLLLLEDWLVQERKTHGTD